MNVLHRQYCRSNHWARLLGSMLPWALQRVELGGARVLELGSGPGRTTDWLAPRVGSLTTLERDATDASRLAVGRPGVESVHGDATEMPFVDGTFDVVVCFTMLHHVPTRTLQDQLFAEARRVLRPGGCFAGSDSRWGPLFALAHVGDTMTLVDPVRLPGRLRSAGFAEAGQQIAAREFRFCAWT